MIENATEDIRYLLERGYPLKSSVSFVCNHYRLNDDSRYLLSRVVIPKEVAEKRKAKFSPCDELKGNKLAIDGYNIIIGMESILEKKAYYCDDGVIRDIKGVFRNYKASDKTEEAIKLILQFLKENKPDYICFLLDSQISKSGMLAKRLREKLNGFGLKGDARTSKHVDYDLKNSEDIVASSDGVIIDAAENVVNFLHCIVAKYPHLTAGITEITWKK